MSSHACNKCFFFKNMNDIGVGLCCRFPPVPVSVTNTNNGVDVTTRYPEVQSNMWCGEYLPKD